jgi:predicted lipid-binding transport protein (Tim44 family)
MRKTLKVVSFYISISVAVVVCGLTFFKFYNYLPLSRVLFHVFLRGVISFLILRTITFFITRILLWQIPHLGMERGERVDVTLPEEVAPSQKDVVETPAASSTTESSPKGEKEEVQSGEGKGESG